MGVGVATGVATPGVLKAAGTLVSETRAARVGGAGCGSGAHANDTIRPPPSTPVVCRNPRRESRLEVRMCLVPLTALRGELHCRENAVIRPAPAQVPVQRLPNLLLGRV